MKTSSIQQLTAGNQLFVGLTYNRSSVVAQHIALWEQITSTPKDRYLIMKMQHEFSDPCNVLFFTKQDELKEFENWWNKYAARFPRDQIYEYAIPRPQAGEYMSGFPLMHNYQDSSHMPVSMLQKMHLDQWYWIAEHTSDPVLYTKDFWLFASEADMVMFKLRDKKIDDEYDDDENASLNFYKK